MHESPSSRNSECPLCRGRTHEWCSDAPTRAIGLGRSRARTYLRCGTCGLVVIAPGDVPTPEEERERYLRHTNDPDDREYRAYLSSFVDDHVAPVVAPGGPILDFGSGPHPVLASILNNRGYRAVSYDPFFSPDRSPLDRGYDAVVVHEVIEHIRAARAAFDHLFRLLAAGGSLIVRTHPYPDSAEAFSRWWYRSDPTHVAFYSGATFSWIADAYYCEAIAASGDVFRLRVPARGGSGRSAELLRT
jgi:SAM-dependent methyltransferase